MRVYKVLKVENSFFVPGGLSAPDTVEVFIDPESENVYVTPLSRDVEIVFTLDEWQAIAEFIADRILELPPYEDEDEEGADEKIADKEAKYGSLIEDVLPIVEVKGQG